MKQIRVGLLGFGNVGAALAELVQSQHDEIARRLKLDIEITRVAVRDLTKARPVDLDDSKVTTDANDIVSDPEIDVVVELIGGTNPARELILAAIANGKPVVTGNKELLAKHGPEIYAAAAETGVDILFEASVGAAIPLLRSLRESLRGEPITRVMGIVNGTTNYILSQMTEAGSSYEDALAQAQELGYAEADPTADVEGHDAAAKAAIIATVAFGQAVSSEQVFCEGISHISAKDIEFVTRSGFAIKLLAIVESTEAGLAVRVYPVMVPLTHPLASVRDSFNAVFIEGDAVGELMLYGRGAGGLPTSSAVLGDLIDAAINLSNSTFRAVRRPDEADLASVDDLESAFYMSIDVLDAPGVLSDVSGVFGRHGVSIRSMEQNDFDAHAHIGFITHVAREHAVQQTLAEIESLDSVRRVNGLLRVIGDG